MYKPEVESRTQGSRPRPRTQKKSEAKTKDSLSEDRHSRGQGQECSRPRPRTKDTNASALQKKRYSQKFFRRSQKKGLHKNFQAISTKKRFPKNCLSAPQNFNNSKSQKCCPRTEDRPIFEDLRPRGQGQGLDLRGQGLQNVSSRTSSRPRMSLRTPPLV